MERPDWRRIKRSDVLFVIGIVAFIAQAISGKSDRTIVLASLVLMGFPIVTRVDDQIRNGK